MGNLGPVANAKGEIDTQIRDLDQTVIGNPAHDLIRLALSLASAARGSNLPGVTTARMLEQITEGYLGEFTPDVEVTLEPPQVVSAAQNTAVRRHWKKLARERIRDTKPHIPLGKKFWPLSKDERRRLDDLVHSGAVQHLVTALHTRATGASVELIDAAYWVKGCSSLGLMRYALLVSVDEGAGRSLSLIDVKEAVKPAAPRAARVRMPTHNGERVLEGARRLSPFLGDRMAAATVLDHAVFVRELLPEDLKLEIETLDRDEAVVAARFLAGVVGRAHARQLGADDRKSLGDRTEQIQIQESRSAVLAVEECRRTDGDARGGLSRTLPALRRNRRLTFRPAGSLPPDAPWPLIGDADLSLKSRRIADRCCSLRDPEEQRVTSAW